MERTPRRSAPVEGERVPIRRYNVPDPRNSRIWIPDSELPDRRLGQSDPFLAHMPPGSQKHSMKPVTPLKTAAGLFLIGVWLTPSWVQSQLRVPAATAYAQPDGDGIRISPSGISHWNDSAVKIKWFGKLKQAGELNAAVVLRPTLSGSIRLRMSVGDQDREVSIAAEKGERVKADFGSFRISKPGYQSLTLAAVSDRPSCDVESLELQGAAAKDAEFNLKPRRNAASVHLFYPLPENANVTAFYCEMTGVEDPLWTYYMACGWHRGYFGMQVNSPTERRIIFSVWDSGEEAVDRDKVADTNRVKLVQKGENVVSGSFGNEGTGGHSHLKFEWKTGEKQRFLVTAEPVDETHTIFAGYYFRPDKQQWMLISSWIAPKEGKYLRGLYSFSENFVGRNGHLLRKALYGNQWICTSEGQWIELTEAKFSHDPTGKSDRLDRYMGLQDGQFFLSHGGFVDTFTPYGERFTRPKSGRSPEKMELPPLPPDIPAKR